jgi:DNA-binding winged helix-turn-helix (wHTH) protein
VSFRLDAGERQLLRDGKPVQLAPKVFDTLVALVENSGRLVDKDELMTRLWPDTFVEEATLARNISDLRKALGESPSGDKYIETVPKGGYRFVAPVTERDEGQNLILQRQTRSRVVVEQEIEERTWLRSIAVLPFKLLAGGDPEDYLGLGMADALITRFVRRIRVRPTSAIARYLGTDCDPVAAGREMGVDLVLEGNIQRSGDRIRRTVQLVNIGDGTPCGPRSSTNIH